MMMIICNDEAQSNVRNAPDPSARWVAPSVWTSIGSDHAVSLPSRPLQTLEILLPKQSDAKLLEMSETLAYGYPSESTQRELSNEYQHDRD